MEYKFTGHALRRMVLRAISPEEVKAAVQTGTVIKEYPDDKPNPSRLILARINNRPIHVVSAYEKEIDSEIIITAYEPDKKGWSDDFTERRQ